MIPPDNSPFLADPSRVARVESTSASPIADRFPVSPGHALVIPRRPFIATWWEATDEERAGSGRWSTWSRNASTPTYRPDGYNVGFNAGAAAGPDGRPSAHPRHPAPPRRRADPRGGIRHVIPGRGNYLLPPAAGLPPLVDGQERTLRLELLRCLRSALFDRIDLVVSFIMKSGLAMIARPLEDAIERGARARILTTDYLADHRRRRARPAARPHRHVRRPPGRAGVQRPVDELPSQGLPLLVDGRDRGARPSSAAATSARRASPAASSGASASSRWRRSSPASSASGATRAATR